mmetsp:Transcript_5394/g.11709  ORF Transcript_5394/g.11709 Transcript_5394/m.11709 type:complete len:279 (-) Transcript_5394:393-1229(-)
MCRVESTRVVSMWGAWVVTGMDHHVFCTLSSMSCNVVMVVELWVEDSSVHVDSEGRILAKSVPSRGAKNCSSCCDCCVSPSCCCCGGCLAVLLFLERMEIDVAFSFTSKSLERIPSGNGMCTVTSSRVCVHTYRVVDPPLPMGICLPSSVYLILLLLLFDFLGGVADSLLFVVVGGFVATLSPVVVLFLFSAVVSLLLAALTTSGVVPFADASADWSSIFLGDGIAAEPSFATGAVVAVFVVALVVAADFAPSAEAEEDDADPAGAGLRGPPTFRNGN